MPITPDVLRLNEQFRAMLLANERQAAGAMVRYYGVGWQKLQADIGKLSGEITKLQNAGVTIDKKTATDLIHMLEIQRQVDTELTRFAKFADTTISAEQRTAIVAAERQAYELIETALPGQIRDVVSVNFHRLPREAVESLVGFVQDGTPLGDLIAGYVGDSARDFSETLVSGLIAGQGPRETARQLRNAYGMGLTKALQISRTETLRAYRTATLASYQANSDVLNGWVRSSAKDDRVCMACLLLDGKEYALDEPMPEHISGRCSLIPRTKTFAEMGIDAPEPAFTPDNGRDWFERQDEATQRKIMGSGRYDAWKDGAFTLDQIPQLTHNDTWGDSWTPAPLYKLLGEGAPVGSYQGWLEGQEAKLLGGIAPIGDDITSDILDKWLISGLDNPDDRTWLRSSRIMREQAKNDIVTELSRRSGLSYDEANVFIEQWSLTSNDNDMRSLAIQKDAAEFFGMPLSNFTIEKIRGLELELENYKVSLSGQGLTQEEIVAKLDRIGKFSPLYSSDAQKSFIGTMYDLTQEQLNTAGFSSGDTIRLRRGVRLPNDIAKDMLTDDIVNIEGNVLESWSVSEGTARKFAMRDPLAVREDTNIGLVLEMDVPIEMVVGSARTGFGCLTEGEFVIQGLRGEAKIVERIITR